MRKPYLCDLTLFVQFLFGHAVRLSDAAQARILGDVNSAHAILDSNVILLRPHEEKYLQQAVRVRDLVAFAYQPRGVATRFSERAARILRRPTQLFWPGWFLPEHRPSTQPCRRPRGGAIRNNTLLRTAAISGVLFFAGMGVSCSSDSKAAPTKSEITLDPNLYSVEHPELFKLATVERRSLPTILNANGSVTPDVNSTIHVTSQGSGRVVDLKVRLGDYVKQGDVMLSIHSVDLSGAFSDYQKAVADEHLAQKGLDRAQLLYSHGALAEKDLQQADDTEEKAKLDVQSAEQHVRLLGGDPAHPGSLIVLRAPVSGTIVEQNIAGFEGIKSLDNSPNLFTVADLNQVWVVCDVYENDLGDLHVGDAAEIRMNAYPDKTYHGKVADISRVLDPATRSAKVRIVLQNHDGSLRPGMFAVATFRSRKLQSRIVIPSTAVLRLQDKDWVFVKESPQQFRRVEVLARGGNAEGQQQIQDGLNAGQEIVANALEFSSAVAEQGK
jgi:cobalt-zinc-cadmium efflux system membrane fusion protein